MPIVTRTFRVFVSSTFEDLNEERNALQRDVFPRLRGLCAQHGEGFQAIDLRWGVRDEAALDQQTVEICLSEIRRCQATGVRPNFIVLLGDRYGWQPLPARIPGSEFDALLPYIPAGEAREMAEHWYRLDENVVPPEYYLQPRTGDFIASASWNPVEQKLREALAKAVRGAGLSEKALQYEASATHQEILAGLGETDADRQHVFGFFRYPTGNTDQRPELAELKSYLRNSLPGNITEYEPGNTIALCSAVFTQLRQVIEGEMKSFAERPTLDLEVEAHNRFAQDRCRIFTGRQAVLKRIADYINGPERRPLVLHGESGSGKSAVMAKASQEYKGPGRLIRRFIGATPESTNGHGLLTSLCRQIAPGETPVDYAQLESAFRDRLSVAGAERPFVLFVDAIDQLAASDPARELTWLPSELPPQVRVIVSTSVPMSGAVTGFVVLLEPMSQVEGGQALEKWLREARRTLQPWQRELVLAHFERCGLPLYLRLAAEESKLWKSYAPEDACRLGEGIAGVIDTLFDRLSGNANHGPTLVERTLGYLATARYGLTENELLDLLTEDDAVWDDFDRRKHHAVSDRRLPVVLWSRLSLDLEPYLTERAAPGGTVIAFFHRQLAERVEERFLGGAEAQARHGDLARHFLARPAWLDEGRKTPDRRRAVELAFQQREAHQWTEGESTLFDCQFLFAKVAAGMVLDLDTDYQALLEKAPENSLPRRDAADLIHGALRLSTHIVLRNPVEFASQMVERLMPHQATDVVASFAKAIATGAPRPWLKPLWPSLQPPGTALLRILEGHRRSVRGVAVTPDGKRAISASDDDTLKVWDLESGRALRTLEGHADSVCGVAVTPDGKRAVSASWDKTLKVWDLESGRALRTMEGHSDYVIGVAVTPDGKRAVSASRDKTLKVWDLESGHAMRTLEGHSDRVQSVAVTPDGKWAVSASQDKTLKIWDMESGRVLRTFKGDCGDCVAVTPDGKRAVSGFLDTLTEWDLESGRVLRTFKGGYCGSCVAVTPDGKRAVSGFLDWLTVWDLESGRALRKLEGHTDPVWGVAVTPDGKRAVSASMDKTLKVWDLESGHTLPTLKRHSGYVVAVAVAPHSKRAVSATFHTLKVWDLESGQALRTLEGDFNNLIHGIAVTPDGKRAVSASEDQTLTVWDLASGSAVRTLIGHSAPVRGVAVTPDGKRAISASEDGTLKVWDLMSGRALRTLVGRHGSVMDVAVTPDWGRAVSASGGDGTLTVWDLTSGRALRILEGHSHIVDAVAVTPDGKRAVSASWDGGLKVWDLESGRALRTLEGHYARVNGVAVTPDGKRAVSASDDFTLKVWDLESGLLIATFHCDAETKCCACAGDQTIVAGGGGGNLHFLRLEE